MRRRVIVIEATHEDMINQRYGRLTVVDRADDYISPRGQHFTKFLCRCDCGNYTTVVWHSLTSGRTKSCGCLSKELLSKRLKSQNEYDLSNEYGIGYTSKGDEFYFDIEDFEKIKDYCWCMDDHGYICARDFHNGRHIKIHRIILPGEIVDHINHNKSDNRKVNLRIVSRSQNTINRKLPTNNTSGICGVRWHKRDKQWQSDITFQGKRYYLGMFDDYDDAVKARKAAEEKYFGEFSYDFSMKQSEPIEVLKDKCIEVKTGENETDTENQNSMSNL